MNIFIEPEPLSKRGKRMMMVIVLILIAIWTLAIYAYFTFPQKVPVHFNLKGEPTKYGNKATFLGVPVAFSIAPLIFLLVTKYRFPLINKYPYLVNLPAFFTTRITKIPKKKRGFWTNKYFEGVLALGIVLTSSLFIIELGIYFGSLSGKLPLWFYLFSLSMPLWLLLPFFIYLNKLWKEMKTNVK